MSLSRLENFLKAVRGTTIHVNADSLDATDSIDNDGSSLARPFRGIQRALIEAVRFSYRSGLDNDRFGRTTIVVHPSQYDIDNRPGVIVKDDGSFVFRNGLTASLPEWGLTTNFNVYDKNNELYKLNSVEGGVILPRGVTLWAYDLRKTVIRPLYVPNPYNDAIGRSCLFRLTGAALPEGFTIFDANPNGVCYRDYTTNTVTPNFSHHKLSCYEYVDGINPVKINDSFINVTTSKTDLESYYEKVAEVYGPSSGIKEIPDAVYSPQYYLDLQPVIDEIRIVGSRGKEIGITSIRSGNGISPSTTITVTTLESVNDLSVDTPIQISGIGLPGYDGQFVVYGVLSDKEFQYKTSIVPTNPLPSTVGATMNIVVDTVTSASPYLKKISLRSVYGMCGFLADGNKVSGFKSSVVSEFTGVSVQKDDNAFVKYDPTSGTYRDSTSVINLHKDSRAIYKPNYEHFHIKLINDTFAELVSTFAIGFSKQYVSESGGDITVNASKSDFGSKAFVADGFKKDAFPKDNLGYVIGVIPPKEIDKNEINIQFQSIDVGITTAVANNTRLYLLGEKSLSILPKSNETGYRIGANTDEIISLELSNGTNVGIYTAKVVIPGEIKSCEKSYDVQRVNNNTENSVINNALVLTQPHNLTTGEKIRVTSLNGSLPDGIFSNKVGFAITTGLPTNRVKIAENFNNALNNIEIPLNKKGGNLVVSSRVSDKVSGEIGHPIQWDADNTQWYINVDSNNQIYNTINSLGESILGGSTSNFYIKRIIDSRSNEEKIYKLRYVIPASTNIPGRSPLEGYVLQESGTSSLSVNEIPKYFSDSSASLSSIDELKNPHYISDVKWSNGIATIFTEIPHNLKAKSRVEIFNCIPGIYNVLNVINDKVFTVPLTVNPGIFNNNTTVRNQNLPFYRRLETTDTYKIYKINEIKEYIYNKQDGVYDFIIVNTSNSPSISPFTELKFSQPLENLYPQTDRDNPKAAPSSAKCFCLPDVIGDVVVNDERNSITRETFNKLAEDFNLGIGVTIIQTSNTGLAHTLFTDKPHNLNGITSVSISNPGSNYVPGVYYGVNINASNSTGLNATAKITVNASGNVQNIILMDGGCAYGVGTTATLVPAAGFGTTTGFTPCIVTVTNINNNINDVLYIGDNPVPYTVVGVSSNNRIQVSSASTSFNNPTGYAFPAGKTISISSLTYNNVTGIATLTCTNPYGLLVNEKILLGGFNDNFYNKTCIVQSIISDTVLTVHLGKNNTIPATGGTNRIIYPFVESNNNSVVYNYAGITTQISSQLTETSTSNILVIPNAMILGLKLGDFLRVNNEIFKIRTDVTSNNVSVFRSQLGSEKQNHPINSVVRKIKILPVELRRSSSIRASSHTLEYVGFGPGNYSTGFPERQDRKLSNKEKNLAHAFRTNGGTISYSANDENGDIYNTNKKTYSSTGLEEVYDSPIAKIVGEDNTYDTLSTSDLVINKKLRVFGGTNSDVVSQFDGPVVFNEKITSYGDSGIEAISFSIKGSENISRKIGIGTTYSESGNYGDIIFNSKPKVGQYIGWTYTIENQWEGFGKVGE